MPVEIFLLLLLLLVQLGFRFNLLQWREERESEKQTVCVLSDTDNTRSEGFITLVFCSLV